jgi:hypothetical protein
VKDDRDEADDELDPGVPEQWVAEPFRAAIRLRTPVVGVRRDAAGVTVRSA